MLGFCVLFLLCKTMDLIKKPLSQSIQFYATSTYACSYLPDKRARSLVATPAHFINNSSYSALIDLGFRRSGTFTYRPHCDHCKACTPIRIQVDHFKASRNLRRTFRQFQHLTTQQKPLVWNEEHYALYRSYQATRHSGSAMDNDDKSQYIEFLLSSNVNSYLIEFRDKKELKMVALIDEVNQGLSAVYTFFDPDTPGLGTFGILWQINYCRELGMPWLYLGYWIEQSPKMTYKTRFTPYQLFLQGKWVYPPTP